MILSFNQNWFFKWTGKSMQVSNRNCFAWFYPTEEIDDLIPLLGTWDVASVSEAVTLCMEFMVMAIQSIQ